MSIKKTVDLYVLINNSIYVNIEVNKEKLDELVRITAEENSIKRGLQQGLIQGIEQEKIETTKEMLKENLDIELNSKITKLSKEEILNIKNNI